MEACGASGGDLTIWEAEMKAPEALKTWNGGEGGCVFVSRWFHRGEKLDAAIGMQGESDCIDGKVNS